MFPNQLLFPSSQSCFQVIFPSSLLPSKLFNFGPERSKSVLFRVPERCWAVSLIVKMDGAHSQLGWNFFSSSKIFILFTIIQVLFIWLSSASVIDASGKNLVRKGRSQANLSKLMHYLISSISIEYRDEKREITKMKNENYEKLRIFSW